MSKQDTPISPNEEELKKAVLAEEKEREYQSDKFTKIENQVKD